MLRGTRPTATLVASLVVADRARWPRAATPTTPGTGLDFGDGLDAVTISGDVGAAKIEFDERMTAGELETETLVKGDGDGAGGRRQGLRQLRPRQRLHPQDRRRQLRRRRRPIQVTVGAADNAEPQTLDDVLKNLLPTRSRPA